MKAFKKAKTAVFTAAATLFTTLVSSVKALASDINVDMGFLNQKGTDVFGNLSTQVQQMIASLTSLITYFSVGVMVIGLIICGVQLASKNAQTKEQAKQRLLMIIIGAVLVFGSVTVMLFAKNIAGSFSSSLAAGLVTPTPEP